MLVALAICRYDLLQARRLVSWMGFLSERSGNRLKSEKLRLIVADDVLPSQQFQSLLDMTKVIFGDVLAVSTVDRGVGWPGAANDMFQMALFAAENWGESVFFMEPDGVPLYPEWFDCILSEYQNSGKPFMGGYVPTPPAHMTGIAVYPPNWVEYAPSLIKVPDSAGWDTYCAEEIYPNAHFTPLIQHVFRRHEPGWSIPGLNALDKRAVLFHQDKHGKLIQLLDDANWGGECARHPFFNYSLSNEHQNTMATKFYKTRNATKAIVAQGGRRFYFAPVETIGGSTPGIYSTEKVDEQILLDDLANNPASGVTEITQEQWEAASKKKWVHPVLSTSKRSSATSVPPQAPIKAAPSGAAAVVAEGRGSMAGDPGAPPGLGAIKDINEVLKVGPVKPAQPAPSGAKPKTAHSKIPRKPQL